MVHECLQCGATEDLKLLKDFKEKLDKDGKATDK